MIRDTNDNDTTYADDSLTDPQPFNPELALPEHVERNFAPVVGKNTGKFDLACCSNALNTVLNLRNVADKDKIMSEFEAQLTEILVASDVTPDAWNKLVTRDSQESGQTFPGHSA